MTQACVWTSRAWAPGVRRRPSLLGAVALLTSLAPQNREVVGLLVTRKVCLGCGGAEDEGPAAEPGLDAICFTGRLKSSHYAGHDMTVGGPDVHMVTQWPILASAFPSADVLLIIGEQECDLVLEAARSLRSSGPQGRTLVWCHEEVITAEEQHFMDNSPTCAQQKIRIVSQWREVAACGMMAESLPGPAHRRISRTRYDNKICALRPEALPADALALSHSNILDATSEYLIQDFLLTGPGELMRKLFLFYHWFLDPKSWQWWGERFIEMEPRRMNTLTGEFPRSGPDSETLLKYFLFVNDVPLRRVPGSVLMVGKARMGREACVSWPENDERGYPMWSVRPEFCRTCWGLDGLLVAAMSELAHRRFEGDVAGEMPTLLDLGGGIGHYTRKLQRTGVAAVSVDLIHPSETLNYRHYLFAWRSDLRRPLSRHGRAWRLARFRTRATPMEARFSCAEPVNGSTLKELKFDWALALNIDHLPAGSIAANIRANAHAAVVTGSSTWLDTLEKSLGFQRLDDAEAKLRMFAGTTSCCTGHRSLRVYSSRYVKANFNASRIADLLPAHDPWWTDVYEVPDPEARALWLHAVRAQVLPATTAEDRAMLLRWLGDVDWVLLRRASHSVFDVPLDGDVDTQCESACSDGISSDDAARRLQTFARERGPACLLGCLRAVRRSREHEMPPVRFLSDGQRRFRHDSDGLYAYNVIGAMAE
eukprot:TRINITY_DN37432_c0_g1_i1.p1 TRINITY_DN37432_c0_g1~~TRINITY_DN37432_c0_g1_i1.p1  ORF type:complete len:708 (-),score=114.24 TRINITY_DN37432_c0_g1_i1:145-2268(-)